MYNDATTLRVKGVTTAVKKKNWLEDTDWEDDGYKTTVRVGTTSTLS